MEERTAVEGPMSINTVGLQAIRHKDVDQDHTTQRRRMVLAAKTMVLESVKEIHTFHMRAGACMWGTETAACNKPRVAHTFHMRAGACIRGDGTKYSQSRMGKKYCSRAKGTSDPFFLLKENRTGPIDQKPVLTQKKRFRGGGGHFEGFSVWGSGGVFRKCPN